MSHLSSFFAAVKAHAVKHPGVMSVITRASFYTLGVITSLYVSDGIFNDGYTATISTFMLFAVVFELLWNTPASLKLENCIKNHCMACGPGGSPERIANCEQTSCPLYQVRPYQAVAPYRLRLFCYILCVLGIGLTGFVLAKQSDSLCAQQKMERKAEK